jgi:putrescine transport system substrate-binding protein
MHKHSRLSVTQIIVILILPALSSCGSSGQSNQATVNVYNWSDYFGSSTLLDFETSTSIKVNYDMYDSYEAAETKLLVGQSGYDAILIQGSKLPGLIAADSLLALERSQLPNWQKQDSEILTKLSQWDPGNRYAVAYTWGTMGVTYNVAAITKRLQQATPLTSLDVIFKPELAAKVADCGISIADSPRETIALSLAYLGKNPNSNLPADLAAVEALFKPVRQYIRTFDNSNYLNALPSGDICLAMNWSGDFGTVSARAKQAGLATQFGYFVPESGSSAWIDVWVIPRDAPNPKQAYQFLNYLLEPKVMADVTNQTTYANTNAYSKQFVKPEILNNMATYPSERTRSALWTLNTLSPEIEKIYLATWTKIKSGG